MKAWLTGDVETYGAPGYIRYAPVNIKKGVVSVGLASDTPVTSFVVKAMGPGGELARSGTLTGAQKFAFDTTKFPEGHVVFDAEVVPSTIPVLHAVAIIDNDGKPVTGAQKIPVGARNLKGEFAVFPWITPANMPGLTGYTWVDYPGAPHGAKLKVRTAVPMTSKPAKADIWVQRMTITGSADYFSPRRFTNLLGHPTICERQEYFDSDARSVMTGASVSGPFGVARVGMPSSGFVDPRDDSLVFLEPNGRISRCMLDGTVTALFGPDLKAGALYPTPAGVSMQPPTTSDEAWMRTFYDQVGSISDGSPTLMNPWQITPDPQDPDVVYVTDFNRLVSIDLRTGAGHTVCGSLAIGAAGQGYADGKGTAARFNQIRGVVWAKDGSTMYLADDHGCAIRTCDRAGNVGTLYRAPDPAANNALVQANPYGNDVGFTNRDAYFAYIRTKMVGGPFATANVMHPQSLALDSKGRIVTAGHHPHQLYRFDPVAKTVEILANLPTSSVLAVDEWMCLTVDTTGAFGQLDRIGLGYWSQNSFEFFGPNGEITAGLPLAVQGYWTGTDDWHGGLGGYLQTGPANLVLGDDYPLFCAFGADGSFWHNGWSGGGLRRQTKRLATDPVVDAAKWQRGFALWRSGPKAPIFAHGGLIATDCLGGDSYFDFIGKTDAQVAATLAGWGYAWAGADLAAVIYFLRWEGTQVASVNGTVTAPTDPPANPPPTNPPADVPPTGTTMFESVTKTATAGYPPMPNSGQRAEFMLHGSGGAVYTFGNTYAAVGDASMGINDGMPFEFHTQNGGGYASTLPNPTVQPYVLIQPVDKVDAPGHPAMETNWAGYSHGSPKGASLYTHARLDGLRAWSLANLTMVDPHRIVLTGNSMGGWGGVHWGLRHPETFAAVFLTLPRFRNTGLNDWDTGPATSTVPSSVPLPDGTPWSTFMDMVSYIANPANVIPPLLWGTGKQDSFTAFQEHIDAVAALRATGRFFVFAWNNGTHSGATATETMGRITASYDKAAFVLGQPVPVFSNSSLDTPFTADVGGINLGFKWRNATATTIEIANTLGAVTVDVTYAGATKHLTIPAGAWATFDAGGVVNPPPAAPTITGFTATPSSVNAGDSVVLNANVQNAVELRMDGASIEMLPMTVQPTQSHTYTLTANGPGGTVSATVDVTVAAAPTPPLTLDQRVANLEAWARTQGQPVPFLG